jgi:hypothetical protein
MSQSERRIKELEDEVIKLRHLLGQQLRTGDDLEMESGVNPDLKPFITVRWGDQGGQLSPDEAREHGLRMLEVAEAAEADAALLRGLAELELGDVAPHLLAMIREHRHGDPEKSA